MGSAGDHFESQSACVHRRPSSRVARGAELFYKKLISKPDTALVVRWCEVWAGYRARDSPRSWPNGWLQRWRTFIAAIRPGVHSAAEWALRKWGEQDLLRTISEKLASHAVAKGDRWFVTKTGHTMIVFGPAVSHMGSPRDEPNRDSDEAQVSVKIDRTFAIASKKVTMEQFLKSPSDYGHPYNIRSPEKTCPINAVTWVQAAKYCQWLCQQEGFPRTSGVFPKT